jgi:exopolyphosphatase/pppGpp-phosphohydrolase
MTEVGPDIHRLYLAAKMSMSPGTPVTVLLIGDMETTVVTGAGTEPDKVLMLAIGAKKTAKEFFLHTPPSPGEIENAIIQVEDEITRAREMVAGYPSLFATDKQIQVIASIAGHAGAVRRMSVEDVERVFSLLASNSLGRPSSVSGIPDSPAFAASLLILREFMQHLGFASVSAPG